MFVNIPILLTSGCGQGAERPVQVRSTLMSGMSKVRRSCLNQRANLGPWGCFKGLCLTYE